MAYTRKEIIDRLTDFENGWRDPKGATSEFWEAVIDTLEQEPCDDAISRTDAIAEIYDKYMTVDGGLHNDTAKGCIGVIKELPSVHPSRKGHWIKDEPTVTAPYICSECGMFHNGKNRNFCPYCGAKME